jgi:hypothetical protein
MEFIPSVIGCALLIITWLITRLRRVHRILRFILAVLPAVVGIILMVVGFVAIWYYHRPLPAETQVELFQGITYIRDVRSTPRPLVIHVISIDLKAPGIGFLVTPGEPTDGRQLPARTTSQFLEKYDAQLAINIGYFEPWHSDAPWDYYPHVGDPVDVRGYASSRGEVYSTTYPMYPRLFISRDNKVSFNTPMGEIYNAFAGNPIFIRGGKIQHGANEGHFIEVHPRTAVALNKDGDTLLLFVVDGRQPNYSEGVKVAELGEIALEYGAYTALNVDGGGSSTMIIADENGHSIQLNSPIDNRIPGRERPIANHLGVFALPVDNPLAKRP